MDQQQFKENILLEVAWEVCNQVGGIYTVIRSKAPSMKKKWNGNYCLVGPYFAARAAAEFEPLHNYDSTIGQSVLRMREMGIEVQYGTWLVSGRPQVVLINPYSVFWKLGEIKYNLWERHDIPSDGIDDLTNQVLAFGYLVKEFARILSEENLASEEPKKIVAHFHEWMVGSAIPDMRYEGLPITTVFTTHATLLGRYLAMNDGNFYNNLESYYWVNEAKHFNIECAVRVERAAAHGAEVFTTVSEVTGRECDALIGRSPDMILPNGLNIDRFTAMHEHQVLHKEFKDQIHEFVMGHFFQSYSFDLDKTLYFFTSGRFEYSNKGFDMTLEALARLNYMLQRDNIDMNIVMFIVTKQPYHSINPEVLHSRALMEEIQSTCDNIQEQVGKKLFKAAASSDHTQTLPDLNQFVDDYWRLRLRRTLQSWKTWNLPKVVTHNLVYNDQDEIIKYLRTANLVNNQHDKVKIVYHPDFISPTNPLFRMEYGQFVRGCHLGIFPSYYEPWGYTPLEAMASGVPSVTSDLSGFGDYALKNLDELEEKGIYVVHRNHKSFHDSAGQLANILYSFIVQSKRERINQRNRVESASEHFDWINLREYYDRAHQLAIDRKFGA